MHQLDLADLKLKTFGIIPLTYSFLSLSCNLSSNFSNDDTYSSVIGSRIAGKELTDEVGGNLSDDE